MANAEWMLTDEEIKQQTKAPIVLEGHRRALKAEARKMLVWLNGLCPHRKPDQLSLYRYECSECMEALRKEVLGE